MATYEMKSVPEGLTPLAPTEEKTREPEEQREKLSKTKSRKTEEKSPSSVMPLRVMPPSPAEKALGDDYR